MFYCLTYVLTQNITCNIDQFNENGTCLNKCSTNIYAVINDQNVCQQYCEYNYYYYVNESLKCVDKCLDNELMQINETLNKQMHQCITNCSPSHKFLYNQVCVKNCTPLYEYNGQCVKSCIDLDLFLDAVLNQCVKQCNLKLEKDGEVHCVAACPQQYNKIFNGQCVSSCLSYDSYLINNTLNCVKSCSQNQVEMYYNDEQYCIEECPFYYHNLNCVNSCKQLGLNVIMNRTYSYCNLSCDNQMNMRALDSNSNETICTIDCRNKYQFYHKNENVCVESCHQYKLKVNSNDSCTAKCGQHDKELVQNNETICKRSCFGYYLDDHCETTCRNYQGSDKIYVDDEFDRNCVGSCQESQFYYDKISEIFCIDSCQGRVAVIDQKNYCLDLCRDKNMFYDSKKKQCVKKCASDEVVIENNDDQECSEQCQNPTPYYTTTEYCLNSCLQNEKILQRVESKLCVNECQHQYLIFDEELKEYMCGNICTSQFYSKIKISNIDYKLCQDKCNINQTQQENRCVGQNEICDNNWFKFQDQCVENCPVTHYGYQGFCLPECSNDSSATYLNTLDQKSCQKYFQYFKLLNNVKIVQNLTNCNIYVISKNDLNYQCYQDEYTNCKKIDIKYYKNPVNKECLSNCKQYGLVFDPIGESCVQQCPTNRYKLQANNEIQCSNILMCNFYDNQQQIFVDRCNVLIRLNQQLTDTMNKQIFDCMTSCNKNEIMVTRLIQSAQTIYIECIDKCPDEQFYDKKLYQCVKQCKYYNEKLSECLEQENCTYFINQTFDNANRTVCVFQCPQDHVLNQSTRFCVKHKDTGKYMWTMPLVILGVILIAIITGAIYMCIKKCIRVKLVESTDPKVKSKKEKKQRYKNLDQVKQNNLEGDVENDQGVGQLKVANQQHYLKMDDEFV